MMYVNRKIRALSSTSILALLISWCVLLTSRNQQQYYCHAFSINNGGRLRTKATTATILTPQRQQRFGSSQFRAATTTSIPSTLLLSKSRNKNRHHHDPSTITALQSMDDPNDNEFEEDKAPSNDKNLNESKEKDNILNKLKWGIFLAWSYSFTILGTALSAGLVLNLFGYGYTFSKEDGLHIDTLNNLRTEIQFRKVDKIYQQQQYIKEQQKSSINSSESQPPSILPR